MGEHLCVPEAVSGQQCAPLGLVWERDAGVWTRKYGEMRSRLRCAAYTNETQFVFRPTGISREWGPPPLIIET